MELKINLNKKRIESLEEFGGYDIRCNNMQKDSIFIIQNGTNDEKKLFQTIKHIDLELTDCENEKKSGYYRTAVLDSFIESDEKERYLSLYCEWMAVKEKEAYVRMVLPFNFENSLWDKTYKQAFLQISREYLEKMGSEVKLKNFVVIMFNWIEIYFPKVFVTTKTLSKFPKFVYIGNIRLNEFLFFKLLALCGCDVYCINPFGQLDVKWEDISFVAQILNENKQITSKVPAYDKNQTITEHLKIKEIQRGCVENSPSAITVDNKQSVVMLGYEELAQLASSIVMITVLDTNEQPFATGSGVLINNNGYILTNLHVIQGGTSFIVRFEEEEKPHFTTELIKYHSLNDLALLRIEPVNRKPITIYSGNKLVRGQKVVAIGSPLGLLNTVSDGIIAGFREFQQVSMIQFTAPTSHGSSGGALLNLYGQLVGIVTAGYDDGQNLNLAVDYDTVGNFLRGFI